MTWTDAVVSEPQPTGGLISSFSSYGPAARSQLQARHRRAGRHHPIDAAARTGRIRKPERHLDGVAARRRRGGAAARGDARTPGPRKCRRGCRTRAQPHLWWGNPALGFLDNVHRQGAGMLQDRRRDRSRCRSCRRAAWRSVRSKPAPATTGCCKSADRFVLNNARGIAAASRRQGRHGDLHSGSSAGAIDRGQHIRPAVLPRRFATVTFSSSTVTLGGRRWPRRRRVLVVTITRPARDHGTRLFGGYITLTPTTAGPCCACHTPATTATTRRSWR